MIFPNLNAHLMDRKFCLGVFSLFSLCGLAQTSADSVQVQQLNEAVVNSAQIAKKTGGYILFPSTLQRKHTTNGLDLLSALRLPGVKIDLVEKNIISTTSSGNVIVLINGVESSLDNLQTLPLLLFPRNMEVTWQLSLMCARVWLIMAMHLAQMR